MRRHGPVVFALAAAVAILTAPSAFAARAADCGITESTSSGAAPLTVSFTAACASSVYSWDFGDGVQAAGQTVEHVFAAGRWSPALTSDLGSEPSVAVTSVSLRVS